MSNSVRPHRRQPTRLPRPWDSPGKNTGVGCHFLLQCMKVKIKSLSHVQLLATPWTAAHQAPPSMGCHCLLRPLKPIGIIFPNAFSHVMSLCHISVNLTIFHTFFYYYIYYSDLWSVIFDITTVTHWRLRCQLLIFSKKYFLNKVSTMVLLDILSHT